MSIVRVFCMILVLIIGNLAPTVVQADSNRLNIRPVSQQTVVWCWAAAAEMALGYFRVPSINPVANYQCGIVAMLGGICWSNCGACQTPIGSTFNLVRVLNNYQSVARQYGNQFRSYKAVAKGRLQFNELSNEIDEGRPVLAGISPSGMGDRYPAGMSEHVVVVIGYDDYGREPQVVVNDPMPYGKFDFNPYLRIGADLERAGSYRISYDRFVNLLGYKDSIVFK